LLYRLTSAADWERAQRLGFFASPDLLAAGYIHSSTLAQVADTANLFYTGQENVLALEIDEALLKAQGISVLQRWAAERGQVFSLIAGPIPLSAIVRVLSVRKDLTGQFCLPQELA